MTIPLRTSFQEFGPIWQPGLQNSRGNKRAVWQMYPRSGFWGPGISKILAFFCQGSTAGKGLLGGNFGTGEHLPKPPFWKPPCCEPSQYQCKKRIHCDCSCDHSAHLRFAIPFSKSIRPQMQQHKMNCRAKNETSVVIDASFSAPLCGGSCVADSRIPQE